MGSGHIGLLRLDLHSRPPHSLHKEPRHGEPPFPIREWEEHSESRLPDGSQAGLPIRMRSEACCVDSSLHGCAERSYFLCLDHFKIGMGRMSLFP